MMLVAWILSTALAGGNPCHEYLDSDLNRDGTVDLIDLIDLWCVMVSQPVTRVTWIEITMLIRRTLSRCSTRSAAETRTVTG